MKRILTAYLGLTICITFAQKGTVIPDKPLSTHPKQTVRAKTTTTESSYGKYQTWTVDAQTYPCKSNNANQCLRVKKQASVDFEIIEEDIDNFKYELGYIYTIQVKEIMKTPPISGNESIYKYVWVRTISKRESAPLTADEGTPANTFVQTNTNGKTIGQTNIQTSSPLDRKWYLRRLKESDGHSDVTDDNVMWIEIKTFSDNLNGFGACNTFEAKVQSDLNTTFIVSKLTTRYASCGYKKLEDMFYELLQQADRFEIKDGILTLSKQWNWVLQFVSDPNNKEEITSTYMPPNIVKTDDKIYATDKVVTSPEPQTSVAPEQNKQPIATDNAELEKLQKENAELKKALAEKKEIEKPANTQAIKEQPQQVPAVEKINSKNESPSNNYNSSYKSTAKEESPAVNKLTSESDLLDGVGYLKGAKLESFEKSSATFHGDQNNSSLVLYSPKSSLRFNKSNIPKIFIEMNDDGDPMDKFILTYTSDNNKARFFLLSGTPKNSKTSFINFGYKKSRPGAFEIAFPTQLQPGEYAFINITNKTDQKRQISCFGIDP